MIVGPNAPPLLGKGLGSCDAFPPPGEFFTLVNWSLRAFCPARPLGGGVSSRFEGEGGGYTTLCTSSRVVRSLPILCGLLERDATVVRAQRVELWLHSCGDPALSHPT